MILDRWFVQPALTVTGLIMLGLVPVGLAWARLDQRRVHSTRVAIKPVKFAASIGVYLLTVSWMLGFMRHDRLSSPLVQIAIRGLVAGASFELFCIVLQAARGRASHFNTATRLDTLIAGTMLVVAVGFVATLLPLALAVMLWPQPHTPLLMIVAIATGLVATFVLGGITGVGMARVALGVTPRRSVILPFVGREVPVGRAGLAHFLGVHAIQAFPLMAATCLLVHGQGALWLFAVSMSGYVVVTLALLYHVPRPSRGREAEGMCTEHRHIEQALTQTRIVRI